MKRGEQDRFTDKKIEEMLRAFPGWSYNPEKARIEKTFDRKNFHLSADFIQQIAKVAEEHDHHPDIFLFGYKNVKVMLSTHSAKGVTQNDFDLAQEIDKLSD